MSEVSAADAVERARGTVGVETGAPGAGWLVRRLDREGEAYYLVVFGEEGSAVAVATVSRSTGDVGSWARLPGRGPHLAVDAARARELAGAPGDAPAELVWRASRASKSPLYPVWEVQLASGQAYVDSSGAVLDDPP